MIDLIKLTFGESHIQRETFPVDRSPPHLVNPMLRCAGKYSTHQCGCDHFTKSNQT